MSAKPHVTVLCLEWPSPSRHAGGVGRYAFRLTEWLSRHLRVSVVTGPDPQPLANVSLHPVPTCAFQGQFRRFYVAPHVASRIVCDLAPDVVHSHGDDFPLAWRRRPAPVVRTFHGRAGAEARSGRLLRRANHMVLAGAEHGVRPRLARAIGTGPDSLAAYRADALIPPVLPEDLPPVAAKRSPQPAVVFIGGYSSRKRGDVATWAVGDVRNRLGSVTFTVFGPPGDRSRYPDWVDFRAGATDEEVRASLATAWALLAPSTYEGFGIPAWEAMGSGAVVIGTRNPGLTYLAEGGAALLVDDGDLSGALERILVDPELRGAFQDRGRRRAEVVAGEADPHRYLEFFRAVA